MPSRVIYIRKKEKNNSVRYDPRSKKCLLGSYISGKIEKN